MRACDGAQLFQKDRLGDYYQAEDWGSYFDLEENPLDAAGAGSSATAKKGDGESVPTITITAIPGFAVDRRSFGEREGGGRACQLTQVCFRVLVRTRPRRRRWRK